MPLDQSEWDPDKLIKIIESVETHYNVDTQKEYATGMSMGGHGTWCIAIKYPHKFAAIAPICGDAHEDTSLVEIIKHLPVWVFHGTADAIVPFDDSEKMVEALKEVGNTSVKFTKYNEVEHDSWTETYDNSELYAWFLQHRIAVKQEQPQQTQ